MRKILTSSVLLFLILVAPVAANTVVRTGDQVSVTNEQNVAGNFYAIGNSVVISAESSEDLTMIGGKVRLDGSVAEDVLAVGVSVLIDGEVAGDVRVVGGDVTVSGVIEGDLVVAGGIVEILSSGSVAGDVLVYAASLSVNGAVSGEVLGQMDRLDINAAVAGGIDVSVVSLTLGDDAVVGGDVEYTSNNLIIQSLNSSIAGDTVRNDSVYLGNSKQLLSVVIAFLIVLLSSFVWYFLSRKTLNRVTVNTLRSLPRSAITGVIAFLVLPLVIAVLAISYIGLFVALVCLFGYITLFLLACAALPGVIGQLIMRIFNQPEVKLSPLTLLVGSVTCCVVFLFPVIGLFVLLFMTVIVFGGLVESIIKASN